MKEEFEHLPDTRKETEERIKSLEDKLSFIVDQLSEDFEEIVIITRKTWNVEKDGSESLSKMYFATRGDDYVLKTMVDMVGKQLEMEIRDDL